jgi:hypothetical protein
VDYKKVYLYDDNCSLNLKPIKDFANKTFKIPAVIKRTKCAVMTKGLLLDFVATKKNIKEEPGACQIIITGRLFGTMDGVDKRLHLRSAIFSYPSIISIPGAVEAPAKPKEYYLAKEMLSPLGLWDLEEPKIKEGLKGRFLDYGDRRLPEIVKGLVSQAIFFYLTQEPFCKSKACRLYNAHWQEDLIYSQAKCGKFCRKHRKILKAIRACPAS